MKTLIVCFFVFFSISNIFSQGNIILLFDDDIISEVKPYVARVKADNGEISSLTQFHSQIKQIKSGNYLDSLVFWVNSYGGIKKTNDSIKVLYDFRGNDLTGIANTYPIFLNDTTSNENVINFTGSSFLSNSSLKVQQPFTLVLTIKPNPPDEDEYILQSLLNEEYGVYIDKKNELSIQSGKKLKVSPIENSKTVLIVEFNGFNSRIFIDDILVKQGKLDANQLEGIILGKNNKNNPDYFSGNFYNCGIFNCIISDNFRSDLFNILK